MKKSNSAQIDHDLHYLLKLLVMGYGESIKKILRDAVLEYYASHPINGALGATIQEQIYKMSL